MPPEPSSASPSSAEAGAAPPAHAPRADDLIINRDKKHVQIDSQDVVKLILQFCRDNDLPRTLMTLQEEARVGLNSVDSLDRFLSDINDGRWDDVFKTFSYVTLPMGVKIGTL